MSSQSTPDGFGELLDHEPFVRRLAHNLLDDEHEAEDVVQETWLAALARREQPCASLRSWLGRVTWNVAADRRRSRQRRLAREHEAARNEALPSASSAFEHEATRRHISAALLGLKEPYRTALLLRFYHDLEPREVAARLGVPLETARTRIKRALVLLRARLAGEHARDGRDLRLAFLWLARRAEPARVVPSRPTRASLVPATRLTGLAGAAAVMLGAFWWVRAAALEEPLEAEVVRASGPRAGSGPLADSSGTSERVPLQPEGSSARAGPPTANASGAPEGEVALSGHTLDTSGNPVAQAEVRVWSAWPPSGEPLLRTHSDAAGGFRLTGLPRTFCVGARAGALTALELLVAEMPEARARSGAELGGIELVLGQPLAVRGRVLDERGSPVAGARVQLSGVEGEGDFRASPEAGLYFASLVEESTRTRADGSFALSAGRGLYRLAAFEPAFAVASTYVQSGDEDIELRLTRGSAVEVRVFDPRDRPIAGALVTFKGNSNPLRLFEDLPRDWRGTEQARSDAAGFCERRVRADPKESFFVRGDAEGWGSALLGPFELGQAALPQRLRLSPARHVQARVLDGRGAPIQGAQVSAAFLVDLERAFELDFTPLEEFQVLARATSDALGRVTLAGLPREALQLWIEPPGGSAQARRLALEAGRTQLEIELDSLPTGTGTYEGLARDGASGAPLEGFTLTLLPNGDGRSPGWRRETFRAHDGRYRLPASHADEDVLLFQSPGRASVTHRSKVPTAGVRRLDVELHPTRALSLQVVDQDQRAVPYACLRLADADGQALCVPVQPRHAASAFRCGPDGTAHLLALPATRVRIQAAAHPRGEFRTFELDLAMPLPGVQRLTVGAPELERPPGRFDLALGWAADGREASWSWAAPGDAWVPFRGRIELGLDDARGQRWWTLRGEIRDGVFRLADEPARSAVDFDTEGRPIDAYRTPPPPWGFELDGAGSARLAGLRGLPRPAGACRLWIHAAGAQALALDLGAPEAESTGLSVRLSR